MRRSVVGQARHAPSRYIIEHVVEVRVEAHDLDAGLVAAALRMMRAHLLLTDTTATTAALENATKRRRGQAGDKQPRNMAARLERITRPDFAVERRLAPGDAQ